MVSTLSLRHEERRGHAADRRKIAQSNGPVVLRWRPHRVHIHAAHRQGHRFMGDESRRPQDGSFVDAIERRRLAPRGLVSRRQKDSASRRVFDQRGVFVARGDRKSTRLNSSHTVISYAVFCLKKKKKKD